MDIGQLLAKVHQAQLQEPQRCHCVPRSVCQQLVQLVVWTIDMLLEPCCGS